jgi:hypothetical protein
MNGEQGVFQWVDAPPIIPMWYDGDDQVAGVWRKRRDDMLTAFDLLKVGDQVPPHWKHLADDGAET